MSVNDIRKDPTKIRKLAEAAFKAVDTDGSGYLEKNELEQVMTNVANDIGVIKKKKKDYIFNRIIILQKK